MTQLRFLMVVKWVIIHAIAVTALAAAEADRCFYAGNVGNERFYGTFVLSDGTVLVCGSADDLEWIDAGTPRTELDPVDARGESIRNNQGSNRIAFILRLANDLETVLEVVHFPRNAVEDIRFIKTNTPPGEPTGALFISGTNADDRRRSDGYFIGRLNQNFLNGTPTGFDWLHFCWAEGDHKTFQPWDVDSQGRVLYTRGQPYDWDWCSVHRLKADGSGNDIVENWRTHFSPDGEIHGAPASRYPGVTDSAIVFKQQNRGSLRSYTQEDYDAWIPDGNGGIKKGRYPLDFFFSGPFNPDDPGNSPGPSGYTGYRINKPTQRVGSIVIDKRNDHAYIGFSVQSILPDGNPDFEPAVVAFDETGRMKWWSRLYTEWDDGPKTSSPDQYVDALAVDYSRPPQEALLAVMARCHGNNVINFWKGNSISPQNNPNHPGYSFHNQFTGTNGNIHISWLGLFQASDGGLMYASYNAEYAEGASFTGERYADPNLDGWPNHNAGWSDLNTTRMRPTMHFDDQGRVYVLGTGRRTVTTANAYQKMANPLPRLAGAIDEALSSTQLVSADLVDAANQSGQVFVATQGPAREQHRNITDHDPNTGTITLDRPLDNLPRNGDDFEIGDGLSTWNDYVRVYSPDLTTLTYSSLIVGNWDRSTQAGGGNTNIHGVFPIENGVLVAGYQETDEQGQPKGHDVPTQNIPAWGKEAPQGESAILGRLLFSDQPTGVDDFFLY